MGTTEHIMPQAKRQKKEETVERYGMTMLAEAEIDFCSLGALVHRLDPGLIPWRKAQHVDIHVSGGEFNCSANLADCFGLKTAVCTAMVNYPVGALINERVRGMGVRAPVVFYNRSNEAGAMLRDGDFDWEEIFSGGVRWFHSGGIFSALSETTPELII